MLNVILAKNRGHKMFNRYAKIIIIVFLLALFLLPSNIYAEAPPQVTAFSLSPKEVDTTVRGQQVTVTLALKDDFAGVDYIGLHLDLIPEAGGSQKIFVWPIKRVYGDDLKGVYKGTATLPSGSQEGVWSVSNLLLIDKVNNYKYLQKRDIELLFGPGSASITNIGNPDTSPPEITSLSITPKEFNTEASDQEVTITATVTDDFAGLSSYGDIQLWFTPDGSSQYKTVYLNRVAGDKLNGTYSNKTMLPKGSQKGVWRVSYIYLKDMIRNTISLEKSDIESLFGSGAASTFNAANISDTSAPKITSFSLFPKVINTEEKNQEVTVTVSLTDDLAGVGNAYIRLIPESGSTQSRAVYVIRVAGDNLNGIYKGTLKFPAGSKKGIWSVTGSRLRDILLNRVYTNKSRLESLFGVGSASITNEARFDDTTPPDFAYWDTTPPIVDAGTDKTTRDLFTQDATAYDAESDIATYAWTKQSGPGEITFGSADAEDTTVRASEDGTYVLRLTVTDKGGNSAYDEMTLIVPSPEPEPVPVPSPEPDPEPVPGTKAPNLTQFVLTPKIVHTGDRDHRLNLMVHLTDDKEGVYAKGDQADPSYTGPSTMMRLRHESGGEKVDFILGRVSGDGLKGVYTARPIMPKGSRLGTWRVEYLYLVDRAGKYKYLSATEIDALLPGKQGTTIINKGHPKEGKPRIGPKTYVNGYRAKAISKKKVATASLSWKVKNNTRTAYVKLKIQKRVKSKLRVKKKARYLKTYRKYRGKYLIYKKKYRKTRNRTLRKRYQRAAVKYKRAMNKYLRAYRKTKTIIYKTVKTANYRWTSVNKWRSYNFRARSRGVYKYYVYAKDKAGNSQQNIARGSFRIR